MKTIEIERALRDAGFDAFDINEGLERLAKDDKIKSQSKGWVLVK